MNIRALRIILGLFFVLLGVLGVLPQADEGIFSLSNRNHTLEVVFGIVEIICGMILLGGFFGARSGKRMALATYIVLFFWIARIVLSKFIWGHLPFAHTCALMLWSLYLLNDLVILFGIWVLNRAYD